VNITEKSGNLRKDLNQDILVSVSSLRKQFSKMKMQLKSAEVKQKKLREEVKNAKEEKVRGDKTTRQVAPSLDCMQQYTRSGVQLMLPTEGRRRKLFSETVKKEDNKRHRITLAPKDEALSPEHIEIKLKRNINPTDVKVGITAIRTIRERRMLIETGSEEEMNKINSEIETKLGERVEVTMHRLRKPRLIIYNVPEEIKTQKVAHNHQSSKS